MLLPPCALTSAFSPPFPSLSLPSWYACVQVEKFKKANKYIKEDTIWSYTIQIARALNEMHSRNILHRDIKPKNVFLTGKNHVRMGDLGCAKFMKTGLARTQVSERNVRIRSWRPLDSCTPCVHLSCTPCVI